MRPVVKGTDPGPFTEWNKARDPLLKQIGKYCSHCEIPLELPDIEHKEPKEPNGPYAHRALDWDNFLFACTYCNTNKGTRDPRKTRFLFPDEVNTACLFEYQDGGFIALSRHITGSADETAAVHTRDTFLKLNRILDTNQNRDLRWQQREDVWDEAKLAFERLARCDTPEMREQIVNGANGMGCFSVWLTVFAGDADMCNRFIAAFPGTRTACFDANGAVINDLNL